MGALHRFTAQAAVSLHVQTDWGVSQYLVPVLRRVRYAQLQQHQLLVLADTPADAVVYTLTAGGWLFQLHMVVTACRANHRKPAKATAPPL